MTSEQIYSPPPEIEHILAGHGTPHRIMAEGETPQDLLMRVSHTLLSVEANFGTPNDEIDHLSTEFAKSFTNRTFIPGIPTLTNAGRPGYEGATLSSCVAIPVDLSKKEEATETILAHYKQNMGSGFNFTKYEDPVGMLRWLNDLSAQETRTGNYDRRIANMGTLHVSHPKIQEFIEAKVNAADLIHFNISVEITDEFITAAINNKEFTLANGTPIRALELLQQIAQAAWHGGDPGLVNLDRMNSQNPLAATSAYDCTPPCGEMGLAPGETCQFGYISLPKYIDEEGLKTDELAKDVKLLVRILDNAVEIGIENQPTLEGVQMAKLKRKIGISVVGLADALIKTGVAYDSEAGRQQARDMVSFINYHAKLASVQLAKERGACEAMALGTNNLYFSGYITKRYGNQPTRTVTAKQWEKLDKTISETGMLRNLHHTALPPGGRASIILGVNHSIEPIFSPANLGVDTTNQVLDLLADSIQVSSGGIEVQDLLNQATEQGTFQNLPITSKAKRLLRTAIEIAPKDHVLMAAALAGTNGVTDESVSKTVNLPNKATPDDISDIYLLAHEVGLKNISVYRDGSLNNQPRKLS